MNDKKPLVYLTREIQLELPIFTTSTNLTERFEERDFMGIEPRVNVLPLDYSPRGILPKQAQSNLMNNDLNAEMGVWLSWMWDSAQPPTRDMGLEAIYWLRQRDTLPNEKPLVTHFISEISGYLGTP